MIFFRFLTENGSQNGRFQRLCGHRFGTQDRSKHASATQPRDFIDFGSRFDDILKVLASKIKQFGPHGRTNSVLFSTVVAEACRFLASHLLASSGRCPWGAAVSLCVYNDMFDGFSSQLVPFWLLLVPFSLIFGFPPSILLNI